MKDNLYNALNIFEKKCLTVNAAPSIPVIISNVKQALIDAYNNYLNSNTAKEPVIQMIADSGEPFCKKLLSDMEGVISNIDELASKPELLFAAINEILRDIEFVKNDPSKGVRSFIHDSVVIKKQHHINYREHLKSKFELVLHRLSSVLEKQAKYLKAFTEKGELEGGSVERERKQLSKEKLLMFMRSPAAKEYGLDSLDIMEKILADSEMKEKLTTLINAIDRGHYPLDGSEIKDRTKELSDWFKSKKTNQFAFEDPELNLGNKQLELAQKKLKELKQLKKDRAMQDDPIFMQEQMKSRTENEKFNEEQSLLNKFNQFNIDQLKKGY